MSKRLNLDAMSVDEMWQLHEKISQVLSVRLASEKRELEKRLATGPLDHDAAVPFFHFYGGKMQKDVLGA